MAQVLCLDVDGVILNHVAGMRQWAINNGMTVGCAVEDMDCYSMRPMFPTLTSWAIEQLLVDYSLHEDFASIPVMDGFDEAIRELKREFPDMRLITVTAPGNHPTTISYRKQNLERYGFQEYHILPMGSSKRAILGKLPKGAIFVDDLIGHVQCAENLGHHGILFRQPHNKFDTHTRTVSNWNEALPIIRGLMVGIPTPSVKA